MPHGLLDGQACHVVECQVGKHAHRAGKHAMGWSGILAWASMFSGGYRFDMICRCAWFAQCRSGCIATTFNPGDFAIVSSSGTSTTHVNAIWSGSSTIHRKPHTPGHTIYTHLTARTSNSFPLPEKLVKRILDREYVDMAELVQDTLGVQDEEQNKCCHQNRRLGGR